jgi:hypothetical protein
MKDIDIQVWEILQDMFIISRGNNIKSILVKKKLIFSGGKYKWEDGIEYTLLFEDVIIPCSKVDYYEDTNDYKQKNIIVETVYGIGKIQGIEVKDIITFLKYKLRVLKIQKFLYKN